jgi:hypothetical protein
MITEKVFEILGEGGGISIIRQKNKSIEKFLYIHVEVVSAEEGFDINEKEVYQNFEEPFLLINNKYPWYMLHIKILHNNYREFVIKKLLEKLNEKHFKPDYLRRSKNQLEKGLGIKLDYTLDNNEIIWTYTEADK